MKASFVVFASVVVAVYALSSCGGGNSPTPPDASTTTHPDSGTLGQPDGSNSTVDSGTNNQFDGGSPGIVGQYCSIADGGTATCPGTGICVTTTGATGGQCSYDCSTMGCPNGQCVAAAGNLCFQPCSATAPCVTGQVCANFGGGAGSFCVVDCTVHMDECGAMTACDTTAKFCTQVGATPFGGECSAAACGANLTCLGSATHAFCSQPCSNTIPCPTTPAGAQCDVQLQTGQTFCGFPCSLDAGACPATLTCLPLGGTYLCQ